MKPYYDDGTVTIYHGDCLDVLPLLEPVGAVIADPPYAIPTIVAATRSTITNVGDLSIPEGYFRALIGQLPLAPEARMFWFCDGNSYPVIYRAAYGKFQSACLVWDKGRIGMGREFRKSHELILHLWTRETAVFADGVGRPDVLRAKPLGSSERVHPAEKPLALLDQLVPLCAGPVLDPFCGSGTALAAARNAGRRAIGIEIDERYCEIAAKRCSQDVLDFGTVTA